MVINNQFITKHQIIFLEECNSFFRQYFSIVNVQDLHDESKKSFQNMLNNL